MTTAEPFWLSIEGVLIAHDLSLEEHGGPAGVRDIGLLESALDRPRDRHAYEGVDDTCELAATYAVAIAKNHPFIDGNKRTAFLACFMFLQINGLLLQASEPDATAVMMSVAAGDTDVGDLAAWLRANTATV